MKILAHVPLKRSPDGQCLFADAELPNVVFEVAYSQDPKQLPKLAKGYIHHSWGDIKAVLCFTIAKSKESTVSVWEPAFYPEAGSDEVTMEIEQVAKSQVCPYLSINRIDQLTVLVFRTADGTPINQDYELVLDLHDFIPDPDCDRYPNPPISIPYSKLYESLLEAERRSKPRRKFSHSKRGVKRSRLSSDSVESVAEEDRKQWNAKDRATRDKRDAEDWDYLELNDEQTPNVEQILDDEHRLNDEQRPAKRSQQGRACTKPPIVELDSNEAAAS
ncbi:uncharacterized protein FFB20_09144 [Fusarium fujikuroi]|uniref:Uncharacterized protein n=2 Tax=Fusarium fujikuroi TaxID=5127 RepID=S0EQ22_GIBF5|nr:uncharacterized protein FFUJ_14224 [Fusarium fujikuroi IMI 58289]KLO90149.1 uncharacterized protein Y057_8504 [Fusarium fujikuroi]KLP21279.1 uncharacterized protein LW94_6510 [Fusarium fujikuroi]QGI71336.1 hypothetical protein CEK27_003665 [Fusarium fujikuroi]QGI88670.1 hypothetical protein CEK25_003626 [Fusarium fujikuroi]QGJ02229.1 hypothetical protein CEK26_003673 [Fusarium fujikuroi]